MLTLGAKAQSAIERHVWQDARSFQPYSRTATAITGSIVLSGNPDFAKQGSTMTISFAGGDEIQLISEGASWRKWSAVNGNKLTAEVYRLEGDPGALANGNELCGGPEEGNSTYFVFTEDYLFGTHLLQLAVFRSSEPPHNIDSPRLCGTFSCDASDGSDTNLAESVEQEPNIYLGSGKWTSMNTINPLDDTVTVLLFLDADSGLSAQGDPIALIARCQSDATEIYVNWGEYLGDDSNDASYGWKNVTVRVGEGEARVEEWGLSTNKQAVFAPGWAGGFLKELLGQERLVLQTVPYGENPKTAILDLTGLENVLGDLADACHWSF